MNRIVMIRMPDGFNGIYLLVDHKPWMPSR